MQLRQARRGRNAGSLFWGCPRFPKCRGSRNVDFKIETVQSGPAVSRESEASADDSLPLQVGGFVLTHDPTGLAKLVDLSPDRARVRIVHSTASQEERDYDPSQLERTFLPPQTRVYLVDESNDRWVAGRVIGYDRAVSDSQIAYVVRLPGREDLTVLESNLEARCFARTVDPTDVLATGGFESQFFADRRIAAIAAISEMRRLAVGTEGLLCASVSLLPHQVEVVRRVMADPVQRYLLADEVGLGKTIEVGAILRQIMSDRPEAKAAIVVPETLIAQWATELQEKFDLSFSNDRLEMTTPHELSELSARAHEFEVLIVDEVHHLVDSDGHRSDGYEHLRLLARSIPRVLLLSATPVLSDDSAALALLHILDPATYQLSSLDGFKQRLNRRERYGQLLIALDSDAPEVMLAATTKRIKELLPEDQTLADLADAVSLAREDPDARRLAVNRLRHHFSDTYRLHHRLLRTRRKDVGWPGRRRQPVLDVDEDIRVHSLWSMVEEWRVEAQNDSLDPAVPPEASLVNMYAEFVDALGQGVRSFEHLLRSRLPIARRSPIFADEVIWLKSCLDECASDPEGMDRIELAVEAIKLELSPRRSTTFRCIAFCTSTEIATRLAAALGRTLEIKVSLMTADSTPGEISSAAAQFAETPGRMVIVADRSCEEGLNLQHGDVLVHVDLPLSASRVEQRIGRLDRLGRRRSDIPSRVLLPTDHSDSPWAAWHEFLTDALGIYERSLSDVQFLLDDIQYDVWNTLFLKGPTGLRSLVPEVRRRLQEERRRLDQQYALDRMDMELQQAVDAFRDLEKADSGEVRFGEELDGWLVDVLNLNRRPVAQDVFSLDWSDRTRAPKRPWQARLEPALGRKLTYRRSTALSQSDVRLIRPGFSLVDGVEELLLCDDRGTAFATWRSDSRWPLDEEEWLGFRFMYLVEVNGDLLRDEAHGLPSDFPAEALRRQCKALFPSWLATVELDSSLSPVTDRLISDILHSPYDRHRDMNLAERPTLLYDVIDEDAFGSLCRRARTASEDWLRRTPDVKARLLGQKTRAIHEIELRKRRIQHRSDALARIEEWDSRATGELAALALQSSVLEEPLIRLESVGCFVISRERPE